MSQTQNDLSDGKVKLKNKSKTKHQITIIDLQIKPNERMYYYSRSFNLSLCVYLTGIFSIFKYSVNRNVLQVH